MKPTPASEPLEPLDGGINCIVAERKVSDVADHTSEGVATVHTLNHLQRDIGCALMQLVSEEPGGTVEIQLTVAKEEDKVLGLTTHQWRLDVWKARQRNYIRVPITARPDVLSIDLPSIPDLCKESRTSVDCTHCGIGNVVAVPTGKLPRKFGMQCHRCTLPIWIMLVEEGKK